VTERSHSPGTPVPREERHPANAGREHATHAAADQSHPPRHLDVVIPTHNRADLLSRTLDSLLAADPPASLGVTVIVVDNRSTDHTPAMVESYEGRFAGRLRYVFETIQGRSPALNAGIAAGTSDLVGMIDDDEEIDRRWFTVIEQAFSERGTGFIGGPYEPRWGAPRPAWLGTSHRAAIGWVDSAAGIREFGHGFDAIMMGGNAVVRRALLERVGPYAVDLGRTATRLLAGEDEDMFRRLLAAGARGFYRPDLIIHHYVPPERLQKRYFRRWSFWRAVSMGVMARRAPAPVVHVLGIPRYMMGAALRSGVQFCADVIRRREPARAFSCELSWWDLAGFIYGRHFYSAEPASDPPATASTSGSPVRVMGTTPPTD
jgi:glycosyltransferase involved in cell wall biosynthesis